MKPIESMLSILKRLRTRSFVALARGGPIIFGTFLIISAFAPKRANALSCQSNGTGSYSQNATWTSCGGRTPGTADTVTIISPHVVTLDISTTIVSINVNNGATLTTDNNNRTLTLKPAAAGTAFTLGATGTFTAGNSTVTINPDAAITLTSGAITFNTLILNPTITAARTYTFGSGAVSAGNLLVNPTAASAQPFTVALGAALTVTSTTTITRTTLANSSFSTTTSNYAFTTGWLNIATASTFTANGSQITLNGNGGTLFTQTGLFTANTSTVVFSGDATATLTSNNAITFFNLYLNPALTADRTYTFGTTAPTINGDLTVNPTAGSAANLTVNLGSALTVPVGKTLTVKGASFATSNLNTTNGNNWAITAGKILIDSGGTLTANASVITVNATSGTLFTQNGTGNFSAGSSTVTINPDAAVTLTAGAITFNHLNLAPTLSLGRTYTFGSSAITCNGNLTINPGTAANLLTVNMGANITVSGTTLITRTTNATSLLATTSSNYNLTTGLLNVATGGTLTANGSLITLNGTTGTLLTMTGTFNANTSIVAFASDASVTLTSNNAITFNTIQFTPTLTTDRTYTFGTTAPTINGDISVNPTASSAANLTINLGSAITVPAAHTLTVQASGSATSNLNTTSGNNWAISTGFLAISNGGTLTANNSSITLTATTAGTLFTQSGNGNFAAGASTVAVNLDANVTVTAGTLNLANLNFSPTITSTSKAYTLGSGPLGISGQFTVNPTKTGGGALNLTVTMGAPITGTTSTTTLTGITNGHGILDTSSSNYSFTTGILNLQANGQFNAHGSSITIAGTGTPFTKAGVWNEQTSTVCFVGDGTITLTSGATSFYSLSLIPTIAANRTYTFPAAAFLVKNDLLINPNASSAATLTVNLGGATTVTDISSVTSSGSASSNLSTTGSNLAFTSGNLFIDAGDLFTANGSVITLNGTDSPLFNVAGSFAQGTSSVTITSNADVTLTSGIITVNHLNLAPTITAPHTYTFGAGSITVLGLMAINPGTAANLLTVNMGADIGVASTLAITRTTNATSLLDTGSDYNLTAARLNVAAGGTLTGNGSTITLNGTAGTLFTLGGTFNANNSTVLMNPDAAPTLTSGAITFNNLNLVPTITANRTYTFGAGAITVNNDFLVNPTATSANVLNVNMGAAINVQDVSTFTSTNLAVSSFSTTASNFAFTSGNIYLDSGDFFTANGSIVTLDGTYGTLFGRFGTFTQGTSSVTVTSDADVTLTSGTFTFNHLNLAPTLSGSHTYTFGGGTISVLGLMTINPGTAANLLTVNMGADITIGSTLVVTRTTNATSVLDTTASDFNITAARFNVAAGGTLNGNNSTILLNGTAGPLFTLGGSFNPGNSSVIMNGDAGLTLTSGAISFYDLSLTPTITLARTYTFGAGAITINNNFLSNPTAGSAIALNVNAGAAITVANVSTITSTNLAISSFSTTASNFAFTSGNLYLDSGDFFTANGSVVTLNGNTGTLFTRLGTFTQGTSTVAFTADADALLTSGAITFNHLAFNPTITSDRTYTLGSSAHNVKGFITVNPTAASASTLTVVMGGNITGVATTVITVKGTTNGWGSLDTGSGNNSLSGGRVDIQGQGSLVGNGSTITLSATSGVTFNSTGIFFPGTSSVVMNPDAAVTITGGTPSFYNLTLSPTITVARAYTFGSGAVAVNNDFLMNPNAGSALILTTNLGAALTVVDISTITSAGSAVSSFTTTTGNFDFNTGRLYLDTGDFFIGHASQITIDGGFSPLFTRLGTFTPQTSTVTFSPPTDATLTSGSVTFNHLVYDAAGITGTFGAATTINGRMTINNGELADGGFQITGNATNRLTVGANGLLTLATSGATPFPINFTAANISLNATSTVTYSGTSAQSISALPVYGNLALTAPSGAPTKSLTAATTVANNITIGSNNTLDVTASFFSLALAGDYTNNGTFTARSGTVTFNSSTSGNVLTGNMVNTSSFTNVVFNGVNGGWSPTSAMAASGNLTVSTGTLSGTNDITVNGNVVGNGTSGMINLTGGTFEQRVAAAQSFGTNVSGSNNWTFNHLKFTNGSASNRIITLNPTGSGQIIVNGTLTIGSASDTNSTTVDDATNNRVFDANGDVAIASQGVFQASSQYVFTVTGNWTNSGTFTANTSTIAFNGSGIQTLAGSTTFYGLRDTTSGATLKFTSGTTNFILNMVDWENLTLRSTTDGATWYLKYSGSSQTLTSLTVKDSNAALGILMNAMSSTNSGNNTNWDFGFPNFINNLAAFVSAYGGSVDLTWSAPGDDGGIGTLNNSTFTIQYTTDTIFGSGGSWSPTAAQPSYVYRLNIATTNVSPNAFQFTTVTGLTGDSTYFFRIWTKDDVGNYSPISVPGATNYASVVVMAVQMTTNTLDLPVSINLNTTLVISTSITVTNTGNINETFAFWAATGTAGTPWSLRASQAVDQFSIWAITNTSEPTSTDFSAEDQLSLTNNRCDSSHITSGPTTCVNVPPGASRTVWFKLGMPTATSTANPQQIIITGVPTVPD